jgi:sterol desaturase/sphingolipid hydroxylase (fatty acid hydroxylase superfamily)
MEIATGARPKPAAYRMLWLWGPVFGIGLAAMLTSFYPPGLDPDAAKAAGVRLLHRDVTIGWWDYAALAYAGAWIVAKPLAVIGAIQWLEFRFAPAASPKNRLGAWAAQAVTLAFPLGIVAVLSLLHLLPAPLIRVGPATGTAALLLVTLPLFIVSLLVADFFSYWAHRAMHRFAFLWRFHAIHHSVEVDVLHNIGHPLELSLLILFVTVPTTFLIGVSQEQLYLLIGFTSLQGHINHTRLPIHLGPLGGTLLCDNRYHFLHHSLDPAHFDKNFAPRFPLFDMLFGTYCPPTGALVPTGHPDRAPPRTLGQYLTARLPGRAGASASG